MSTILRLNDLYLKNNFADFANRSASANLQIENQRTSVKGKKEDSFEYIAARTIEELNASQAN